MAARLPHVVRATQEEAAAAAAAASTGGGSASRGDVGSVIVSTSVLPLYAAVDSFARTRAPGGSEKVRWNEPAKFSPRCSPATTSMPCETVTSIVAGSTPCSRLLTSSPLGVSVKSKPRPTPECSIGSPNSEKSDDASPSSEENRSPLKDGRGRATWRMSERLNSSSGSSGSSSKRPPWFRRRSCASAAAAKIACIRDEQASAR